MGFKAGYCLEAERYHKEAVSIPMYPTMSNTQVGEVAGALRVRLATTGVNH